MVDQLPTAHSAWQLFLSDYRVRVSEELAAAGQDTSMGAVAKATSEKWHALDEKTRRTYEQRADAERQARLEAETRLDEARAAELEALEAARAAGPGAREERAGRQDADAARAEKEAAAAARRKAQERREASMSAKERRERERRAAENRAKRDSVRKKRRMREDEIDRQLNTMRAELKAQQKKRFAYLLGQSDLFRHFLDEEHVSTVQSATPGTPSRRRAHSSEEKAEEAAHLVGADEESAPTRLLRQPSGIVGGTMRDYQLEGLNWLIGLHESGINGILADEMGLGKTLQTISLLAWLSEDRGVSGPHLILVPMSTLANWCNELDRWCPRLRVLALHGNPEEREEMKQTSLVAGVPEEERSWDVVVTTYEMANIERRCLCKFPWQYVIVDEAHRLKNENSILAQTVREFYAAHRLLLTGTPLQNNLHELWALLNFLLPDVFGDSSTFDEWFDVTAGDDAAKQKMIRQLHKILRPFMLRRIKADVAKALPPKTETFLYIPMTPLQRDVYRKVLRSDFDAIVGMHQDKEEDDPTTKDDEDEEEEGDEKTGAKRRRALAALKGDPSLSSKPKESKTRLHNVVMQLRKCCNHPYLFEGVEDRSLDPFGEHFIDASAKFIVLDKLLSRLKADGHRVLLFSQMTAVLDILEDFLVKRGHEYCRLDGSTAYADRAEAIDVFNAPDSSKFCFLLSTRAGGLGVNLATADTVILFDSDWNPQMDLQAMDRAHRIGQKKPVRVFRLITSDSVEEKVVERALVKLKLDAVVVQRGTLASKPKGPSAEEIAQMVTFGADAVFRAEEDGSGDSLETLKAMNIDDILKAGESKTEEVTDRVGARVGKVTGGEDGGSMLDFRMDSANMRMFEGVDYMEERKRIEADRERLATEAILAKAAQDESGRRRRAATAVETYSERAMLNQTSMFRTSHELPKGRRLPRLEPWMMVDEEALNEVVEAEANHWKSVEREEAAVIATAVQSHKDAFVPRPLPPAIEERRAALLSEGFLTWKKRDLRNFVEACKRHGRDAVDAIAKDVDGKEPQEVRAFHTAFWSERGRRALGEEWVRIRDNVARARSKVIEHRHWGVMAAAYVGRSGVEHVRAWNSTIQEPPVVVERDVYRSIVAPSTSQTFSADADRFLIAYVARNGWGRFAQCQAQIMACPHLLLDTHLRTASTHQLRVRAESLMRAITHATVDEIKKRDRERVADQKAEEKMKKDTQKSTAEAKKRAEKLFADREKLQVADANVQALQSRVDFLKAKAAHWRAVASGSSNPPPLPSKDEVSSSSKLLSGGGASSSSTSASSSKKIVSGGGPSSSSSSSSPQKPKKKPVVKAGKAKRIGPLTAQTLASFLVSNPKAGQAAIAKHILPLFDAGAVLSSEPFPTKKALQIATDTIASKFLPDGTPLTQVPPEETLKASRKAQWQLSPGFESLATDPPTDDLLLQINTAIQKPSSSSTTSAAAAPPKKSSSSHGDDEPSKTQSSGAASPKKQSSGGGSSSPKKQSSGGGSSSPKKSSSSSSSAAAAVPSSSSSSSPTKQSSSPKVESAGTKRSKPSSPISPDGDVPAKRSKDIASFFSPKPQE